MTSPILMPGAGRELRALTAHEQQLAQQVHHILKGTNMEEATTVLTQVLVRGLQACGVTRDTFAETALSIWDAVAKTKNRGQV